MSARLVLQEAGDVTVIAAYGKLAAGEGRHSVHAQFQKLVDRGRLRILLNVAGVPSMDSHDIGELMAGYAAVTVAGGELKLAGPRARVEEVLRTTRLSKLLGIYQDDNSAILSFAGMRLPHLRIAAMAEPRSELYIG